MFNEVNQSNKKCIEDVVIPPGFRELLQDLADDVLRVQPSDILAHSADYLNKKLYDRNIKLRIEEERKKERILEMAKIKSNISTTTPKNEIGFLNMEPAIKTIYQSDLFVNVDRSLIANLGKEYEVKSVSIGEEIHFSSTEESKFIYFIQKGKFDLFLDSDTENHKIGEMDNQGYFGDSLDQIKVVAKSQSMLIVVKRSDIDIKVLEAINERRKEYLSFVSNFAVFEKLHNFWKRIIIDSMIEKSYEPDQKIINEGYEGLEMFLILEGFVSIESGSKKLDFLGQGMYFGELAVMGNVPRIASAISCSQTKVLVITQNIVKTIIEPLCREPLDKQIKTYFETESMEGYESEAVISPFEPRKMPRKGVSAGKFDPTLSDEDDEDNLNDGMNTEDFIKTEEQKVRLMECCKGILLFRRLDEDELEGVVGSMFQKVAYPGDVIIKIGDDGDNFYIVDNGIFDIIVPINGVETIVAEYNNSGSFGELALMYNTPRSATVIARTNGLLWAMNRERFRRIVLNKAYKKRLMYETLLSQVSIFHNISDFERSNVADALWSRIYEAGTTIIKQGEEGLNMFFIEEGKVEVRVDYESGLDPEIVGELERGRYFGEMALINQKPRVATVTAKTRCKIAVLDRESFERLLGPCIEVMKRNMKDY